MSKPTTSRITESHLSINLNEEAHDFIRELAMACRKMSIYGASHPTAQKAIEKPFLIAGGIFRFKRYVNLNAHKGDLYLLNIRLKESPFTAQIIQFLQVLDVKAVLFDREMLARDFSFFLESITTRQMVYNAAFNLAEHLAEHKVETIQVNSELAYDLFERRKQYRGDVSGDFSVRRMALDQLGDDPVRLARVRNANEEGLLDLLVDFNPELIAYLLPERVAALDPIEVRKQLTRLAEEINGEDTGPLKTRNATDDYMGLFKLVDLHPRRKEIVENLADGKRMGEQTDGTAMSETGAIKIETASRMDQLLEALFSGEGGDKDVESFKQIFSRLLKTGQQPKAVEIVSRLIDLMSAPEPEYRQTALNLLGLAVSYLGHAADSSVLETAVDESARRLSEKLETYEYSEFLWQLFEVCRQAERYDLAARVTSAMAARRTVNENVTVYDSMAVKKAFENISRRITVQAMVDRLVAAEGDTSVYLRKVLIDIGSEQVATALAEIISHPSRQVRQLVLKILAELGKASLKVFSRIIYDDHMFEREASRYELPDEKWYVIRNSIFVLGSLRDPHSVAPLRVRIDDKDVRVRREIIAALEKIGGEEAVDCLTLMADDPMAEVRDAAIIAIGLVGTPENAPLLIDLARRDPRNALKAITALGKLGGYEAGPFLGDLLEDPQKLTELAGGVVSRDDLKVAAVKALGQIGDRESIDRVKSFQKSQSATQKIFFKNSPVNKAISEVLSRH